MKKVTLILFTLLFAVASYFSAGSFAGERRCVDRCQDIYRDARRLCNNFHGERKEHCIREANERLRHCLRNCRD
jgi:hypothetical protein